MPPYDRDLFTNFDRMRRDMATLFGEASAPGRARTGYTPAVDVYYVAGPPRAVVRAELAGIHPDELSLEIRGRELIISGQRRAKPIGAEPVYQRLEVQYGPFRRTIALGADVDADSAKATYENGMLLVVLPIRAQASTATAPVGDLSGQR